MPGAYDKRYEWVSGMAQMKKDGGIYVKTKMKGIAKRIAVTAIAAAVVFGGIQTASVKVEAKGTAFINKKTSKVTPTVKSAKWSKGKVNVTVSVPANKVKKLGKVKKVSVAYGSTKNSKKFEALKAKAKVTKKGKNQYTFTINSKKLKGYKNAYLTVRFDGKSNWSKLVAVKGKAGQTYTIYYLQCSCGKTWSGTNGFEGLKELCRSHTEETGKKWLEENGIGGKPNESLSLEDLGNSLNSYPCGSYKTWSVTGTSN